MPATRPRAASATSAVVVPLRILAAIAVIAALRIGAPVILPIVLAVFLFYMLGPIADRLERWKLPRLLASVVAVFGFVAVLSGGFVLLWPQLEAVLEDIPANARKLEQTLGTWRDSPGDSPWARIEAAAKAIDQAAASTGGTEPAAPGVMRVEVRERWRVTDLVQTSGVMALLVLGQAVTVLFLTVFLLEEADAFKRRLIERMTSRGEKRLTLEVLRDVTRQIMRFIWVQALTATVVAIATSLALWWLGLRQPAVWGIFAGVMNIVPYFGPLIGTSAIAIAAFVEFGSVDLAFLAAGIALIITTLEGYIITPMLLSRAGEINHVAVFVAIAFWSWMWGVPGMFLAVPILMSMKAVCDHIPGLEPYGSFLRPKRASD